VQKELDLYFNLQEKISHELFLLIKLIVY